ncbi:MAG: hypothetical protein J1E81_09130 [Eubacterium sp.]|nr:hypothetical protein [Eubacterium sp.]
MKKSIVRLLAITLALLFVFQTSFVAFAEEEPDWEDATWTQEEFDNIYYQNPNNQVATLASGLIVSYGIAISSSGSNLLIAGDTICAPQVVKAGFKVVTIKRRASSSAAWSTYKEYEDLYNNASSYTLTKTIAVPKGYQYKVYCTHYAKKSLFSTEKITDSSNIIAIG